ncbi:hypothetical protein CSB45_03545 [candidate division KSB3 bacterium]|uniref:Chemotaxis protein n=1 Tax=candidate division KSB3 bacterium TaxID=2044937 RepID=A0A2G6E973_9BACT|nr:MAG: hypothetical protein CSB45_03545 [candidate division KSB3 bacterium]PIE29568.1 MAG: hypothetical protein CSA57_08140 [candidate division KSB3 bacterium]
MGNDPYRLSISGFFPLLFRLLTLMSHKNFFTGDRVRANIHSFWFKFTFISALLITIAVLVNWGMLNFSSQRALTQEIEQKGHIIAKMVRSFGVEIRYREGQKNGDYRKLQGLLKLARKDQSAHTEIAYIFVKNEKGSLLAISPPEMADSTTPDGALKMVNPIPPGNAVSSQTLTVTDPGGRQYTLQDTAVEVIPGQRAELHVGVRTDVRQTSFRNTMNVIGIIIVCVAASAIILRHFVLSQIQNPLKQLNNYIRQIGQGNLEHSPTLNVKNELAELGHGLQDMTSQLKGSVQTEADINRMQGQIMNMLSTVSAAADGNLTVEAEVTADALGSLADAFNMMVASLASLVQQVRDSASDTSLATNEILGSSAQMLKGAEEQQNHINNITSAVDEIAVSMQQVANNAEAAAHASQKATEAAQKGENSVKETIRGMHRIRNTVQVTGKKIKSLGDRSIEINEIITTIDDIARQTTILALNAAIEAARAGEHGRGFGVVAEEVRKLAERSSKATQDIADLIKGIQVETNEAVRTMEEGTREVEEGTRLADAAGSSLKEIDKSVGQVANLIQEISLAAKQQARGTDGVVRSMETISDLTTLYGEGVRKTTTTIQQLAMLSDRLIEAIGNFKIAESPSKVDVPQSRPIRASSSPSATQQAQLSTQAAGEAFSTSHAQLTQANAAQTHASQPMMSFEPHTQVSPQSQDFSDFQQTLPDFKKAFGDDDDDDEDLITEDDFFATS